MPAQALPALLPYAFTAGIGMLYYRRIRRSFGRQPWQPRRTMARTALLSLVLVALILAAFFVPGAGWGLGAGLVAGVVLGAFGIAHTQVESIDGMRSYTPNPWIGGALSLLLVGRLVWRFMHGGVVQQQQADASPLTLAFAAALIGYYLTYSIALMLRMRRLSPQA
jgi:hypothetical protein